MTGVDDPVIDPVIKKQQQWSQFAERTRRLLKEGRNALRGLSRAELVSLIDDYQRIIADLARARSMGAPRQTVDLLNRLAVMGHNLLYGYARPVHARGDGWLIHFARTVRKYASAMGLSCLMLFGPMVISYLAVQWYPSLGFDLVPEGFYAFDPASSENLHDIPSLTRPMVSSSIITNNIQVTLMAFGLGLTAGIGTTAVLVFNGIHIGTVAGWMAVQGKSKALWGWILPHGSTELLAIAIAGGAGYLLAGAMVMPGLQRRSVALRAIGRDAMTIELGVMGMLVIAGLIEGFVSPSALPFEARLGVLGASLLLWAAFFGGMGRKAGGEASLPRE